MIDGRIRSLPSHWAGNVLVCRKCSKRAHGGFGKKGKSGLAKTLRKAMDVKPGRKARFGIVEVGCLGVCPRDAVVMVDGRRPEQWWLVPLGSDVAALAQQVDPEHDPQA